MNSATPQEATFEKQETSAMGKFQAVEFTLSLDQFAIIQHFLPKNYLLLEKKSTKRDKGSNQRFIDADLSKFSGGFDNDDPEGRSKRARTKKIDRYLENEAPRRTKKNLEKLSSLNELNKCSEILAQLKKHPNSTPFIEPVDPKKLGASNYFDIIKEPMDLFTIESKLKEGDYQSAIEFHTDIGKIWYNSYAYNEKNSKIYKTTVEMEKYYKKLIGENIAKKNNNKKSTSKNMKKNEKNLKEEYENSQEDDDGVENDKSYRDNESENIKYHV